MRLDAAQIIAAAGTLQWYCHGQAKEHGWWTNLQTGEDLTSTGYPRVKPSFNVAEKLMLIVSEVAEAMEGDRKTLSDDKLPHRSMLEVELADAVIRVFDLAGGMGLDVAGAIAEKLAYNANRADHKIENRRHVGGKQY